MKRVLINIFTFSIIFLLAQCKEDRIKDSEIPRQENYLVTIDDAVSVAQKDLQNDLRIARQSTSRTSAPPDVKKVVIDRKTINDSDGSPVAYLINFGNEGANKNATNGFVMVSADKRIRPILAKSESGSIKLDGDNPGLKIWLNYVKGAIGMAKKTHKKPSKGAEVLWSQYLDGYESTTHQRTQDCTDPPCPDDPCPADFFYQSPVLTNTSWGQMGPYNMYCPTSSHSDCGSCGIAAAGCAAVAAAQVMNVYQKPATYTIAPAGPVNYVYPLAQSLAPPACTSGIVRGKEVAALIRAAGMWQNTHYAFSKCNSYCDRGDIKNAFASAGYSNSGGRVSWSSNWGSVNSEIQGGHPVIMDASDHFLGFGEWHVWVIDGYQQYITYHRADPQNPMSACLGYEYAMYHMNWGWNGDDNNAWYGFNNFTVDGVEYDYDMNVTRGMRP